MKRIKLCYLLLLISCLVIGCNSVQTSGQIEKSPQNTNSSNIVQTDDKTSEKILFKGENMTVIKNEQGGLREAHFNGGKNSCLEKADEKIKKRLSALNFIGETKYLEFEAEQAYSFGSDKFIVKFDRDLFSRIEPSYLKKIDEFVAATVIRNLYLLKNGDSSYLLAIGPMSATSGMGHYYRPHLLVPVDSNRPAIEFRSISDDPRRIKIANSAAIYYVQIDLGDYVMDGQTSNRVPLIVSLFSVDDKGQKKSETEFDLDCEDINKVMIVNSPD